MISIVIPNYNGEKYIYENFSRVIGASENKKNKIKEIVVVDDGSVDSSVKLIRDKFPEIRLIVHKKNRGFSATVNTGIRSARSELVCLLNNDAHPKVDFLEKVVDIFKRKDVFGVSLHENGYGPASGFFESGYVVHKPIIEKRKLTKTFWVNGGSGVFSRKLWMKVGWLDEKLFSPFYWEDIDISYRAMKRGYKLFWEPTSRVYHEHETSTSKFNKKFKQRIEERNQLLFVWKNLTSPTLFRKHIIGLFQRIVRNPGYIVIFALALSKFRTVYKARRKERKESKVSDEAIFASFK